MININNNNMVFIFTDVLARQSAKHSRQGRRATAHKLLTDNKRSGLLSFADLERPPSTSPLGKNYDNFLIDLK